MAVTRINGVSLVNGMLTVPVTLQCGKRRRERCQIGMYPRDPTRDPPNADMNMSWEDSDMRR